MNRKVNTILCPSAVMNRKVNTILCSSAGIGIHQLELHDGNLHALGQLKYYVKQWWLGVYRSVQLSVMKVYCPLKMSNVISVMRCYVQFPEKNGVI